MSTVVTTGPGNAIIEVNCAFPVEVAPARREARVLRQGPYASLTEQTAVQSLSIPTQVDLSAATGSTTLTMQCYRSSNGSESASTEGATISAIKVETLQ